MKAREELLVDGVEARVQLVPASSRITKVEVAGQDSRFAVERRDRIFDMDVVDAVWECSNELHGIDALPDQVARVKVEAKFFTMIADTFYMEGNGKMHIKSDAAAAGFPELMPKIRSGPVILD